MTRKKFTPEPNRIYENTNGSRYTCIWAEGDCAQFVSEARWHFTAHGVGIYPTGRIDWDYSTHGYFE